MLIFLLLFFLFLNEKWARVEMKDLMLKATGRQVEKLTSYAYRKKLFP
jgi:hypothetical protein